MPEDTAETGPTCLYKDGEAVTYQGEEVANAMAEGWVDHPMNEGDPADEPKVERPGSGPHVSEAIEKSKAK